MNVKKQSICMVCNKFGIRNVEVFRIAGKKTPDSEIKPLGWAHEDCVKGQMGGASPEGCGDCGGCPDDKFGLDTDGWKNGY